MQAYVRGVPSDYDSWAAAGATGWAYKDVLPYFVMAEDCRNLCGNVPSPAAKIDDKVHGSGGPITTSIKEPVNPIAEAFVAACNTAGYPTVDYNAGAEIGASLFQHTVRDGRRCSTATGYLTPASSRPNLTVKTHCQVTRVLLEISEAEVKRAVGVECAVGKAKSMSTCMRFAARREVIISAGAIGSPHILMLSGIGDREELETAGVPCVHHLRGVGASLQDHIMLPMAFKP